MRTSKHSLQQTCRVACALIQHIYSHASVCATLSLCNSVSHCLSNSDTQAHSYKKHNGAHTHCTVCTLPVLVFSCLQMEQGSRSFFSNLLFLSPLLFLLTSLTLWGSMDVLLESIPEARAINKRLFSVYIANNRKSQRHLCGWIDRLHSRGWDPVMG